MSRLNLFFKCRSKMSSSISASDVKSSTIASVLISAIFHRKSGSQKGTPVSASGPLKTPPLIIDIMALQLFSTCSLARAVVAGSRASLGASSRAYSQNSFLVNDPKYSWLRDLGLDTNNPGVFDGSWSGSGQVGSSIDIKHPQSPSNSPSYLYHQLLDNP